MRRNQHALRATSAPRRPCRSLYSARARSGFGVTQSRRTSVGFCLGRSATSSGPCFPPSEPLRLPPPTSQPKLTDIDQTLWHIPQNPKPDALRAYVRRDQRSLVSVLLRPRGTTSLALVTDSTSAVGHPPIASVCRSAARRSARYTLDSTAACGSSDR